MNKFFFMIVLCALISCGEKVMEKPDNLISKEKMTDILYDVSILNAAKNTNAAILEKKSIETMDYIYRKYGIDSVQFVKSDIYYASLPTEYESIYTDVEARLEEEKKRIEEAKSKETDSEEQANIELVKEEKSLDEEKD